MTTSLTQKKSSIFIKLFHASLAWNMRNFSNELSKEVYETMRQAYLSMAAVAVLSVLIWAKPEPVTPATLLTKDTVSHLVVIQNTTIKDGTVSGEVVNNSRWTIRGVQLLIRYIWHWKNEYRPGDDSLSDAVYYTLEGEIAPGKAVPFTYKRSVPLPSRPDGDFVTTVSVAGFTEVIRQNRLPGALN